MLSDFDRGFGSKESNEIPCNSHEMPCNTNEMACNNNVGELKQKMVVQHMK